MKNLNLKKDLQAVNRGIKALSKKVEKVILEVNKLEKSKPVKAKAAKKAAVKKAVVEKTTKLSATDTVLGIIQRSRKGVYIGTLKEKTGFQGQKLYNVLYILKQQGKVKNPNKGIYVKA